MKKGPLYLLAAVLLAGLLFALRGHSTQNAPSPPGSLLASASSSARLSPPAPSNAPLVGERAPVGDSPQVASVGTGAWLSGRVLDSAGQPLANAIAWARREDSYAEPEEPELSVTDAAGRFQFAGAPPDEEIQLVVLHRDFTWVRSEAFEGAREVEVRLQRPAHLTIELGAAGPLEEPRFAFALEPEPPPSSGLRFHALRGVLPRVGEPPLPESDEERNFARVAARVGREETPTLETPNRFAFAHVPAGRLCVFATARDHAISSEALTIRPGERRSLRLDLERGRALQGRVVRASGSPVPGARVRLEGRAFEPISRTPEVETDGQGNFRFFGVAESGGTLRVSAAGFAPATHTVSGEHEVQIRLQRSCRVRGRVSPPGGGVEVEAEALDRYLERQAEPDPKTGVFELSDLLPGSYRLRARGPAGVTPADVEIVVGADVDDLELRLEPGRSIRAQVTSADGPVEARAWCSAGAGITTAANGRTSAAWLTSSTCPAGPT